MAARAMWKGVLRLGEDAPPVPVKLYSGVERQSVGFRLLDRRDMTPVQRTMVDPQTGDAVPKEEIGRGWPDPSGRMVLMDDEDLAELEPQGLGPDGRDIEVLRFVPPETLPHPWYDRPYYLGPDGDPGPWADLAAALERTGAEGVARWVMRKREYLGALRLHRGLPMLVSLRHAEEVVPAGALQAPEGRDLEPREVEMAERLVDMLAGPFEPEAWEDEYRGRVLELIEAKAEGRTVPLREARERKEEEASLEQALQASLEAVGKKSA